jgi:hypothetical protein
MHLLRQLLVVWRVVRWCQGLLVQVVTCGYCC